MWASAAEVLNLAGGICLVCWHREAVAAAISQLLEVCELLGCGWFVAHSASIEEEVIGRPALSAISERRPDRDDSLPITVVELLPRSPTSCLLPGKDSPELSDESLTAFASLGKKIPSPTNEGGLCVRVNLWSLSPPHKLRCWAV